MWEAAPAILRERIKHLVVVMMENRSFDHMLGYLALPEYRLANGGTVEGLLPEGRSVTWEGVVYPNHPLRRPTWPENAGDPPHEGEWVAWQVADPSRYIDTYIKKIAEDIAKRNRPEGPIDPSVVMGYLTRDEVPVYDFLAREYCVCDRWFCSVPGATWPNRMFAIAGNAGGETDIPETALEGAFGDIRTMFHVLDDAKVSWRWFSSDPSLLRAFSKDYRFDNSLDRFAYFRHTTERQERNFLTEAANGHLPAFSWVDPNFFRLPGKLDDGLYPDDDHPPHDVMQGQKFVNTVYSALTSNEKAWNQTLLLITYDEHGGLYDHVRPPRALGPRVPALVVSPWLKPGRPCHTELEHTAIIQTALRLFADEAGAESLGPRVYYANDVLDMLGDEARARPRVPDFGPAAITDGDLAPVPLPPGASTMQRVIEVADRYAGQFVDLQEQLLRIFHTLRGGEEKMPDRQP